MRGIGGFLVFLLSLAGVIAWSPPAGAVLWTEGSSSYSSGSLGGQTLTVAGSGGYTTTSTQWQNTDLYQYTSSIKHKSAANLAFQLPSGQTWDSKKLGWAYEAIYAGSGNGGSSAVSLATTSTGGSNSLTGALDGDFHFKVGLPTDITPNQAPIPGTLALLGFGLAMLGVSLRRRVARG